MAFTYDITQDLGKVRFLVGDTDITNPLLDDTEVQASLDMAFGSLLMAASFCCETLASKTAANLTDIQLGSLQIDETSKVEALQAMADRFREKEAMQPIFAVAEENNCGFTELAIIRNYVQRRLPDVET